MHLKWSLSSIGMNHELKSSICRVTKPNKGHGYEAWTCFCRESVHLPRCPAGGRDGMMMQRILRIWGKEEERETKRMKKRFWFHRGRRHHHPLRRPRMRERERGNDRGSPVHARRVREMGPHTLVHTIESEETICRRNLGVYFAAFCFVTKSISFVNPFPRQQILSRHI